MKIDEKPFYELVVLVGAFIAFAVIFSASDQWLVNAPK